jgi:hypothetical protein
MNRSYGCPDEDLVHYTCLRTKQPPAVDGRLDDPCWRPAPRSTRFVDLVTGEPGFLETRMSALWDDEAFYAAFWIEEPNVRARLTERDSFIWTENDVELFIACPDGYYEFQVNALGTIYEVFYIWQEAYRRNRHFERPEFDLSGHTVDVLGGFQDSSRFGKHPRGRRWAFMNWDFPGLRWGVHVDGTLNDGRDIDRGWTVELAFPWKGMETLAQGRPLPPRDGDIWRMDFSRFEALSFAGGRAVPDPGWALNRHGVYDSHIPECFSFIHFSSLDVESERT